MSSCGKGHEQEDALQNIPLKHSAPSLPPPFLPRLQVKVLIVQQILALCRLRAQHGSYRSHVGALLLVSYPSDYPALFLVQCDQ